MGTERGWRKEFLESQDEPNRFEAWAVNVAVPKNSSGSPTQLPNRLGTHRTVFDTAWYQPVYARAWAGRLDHLWGPRQSCGETEEPRNANSASWSSRATQRWSIGKRALRGNS